MDQAQFSERERDVIQLLLQGKSNKQIASELNISTRTVEFHLGNVYAKLGINTRSEAILKLTANLLRESAGPFQGESTVERTGNVLQNGPQPTLQRFPVKKMFWIAGLLIVALVAIFGAFKLFAQPVNPNSNSPTVAASPIPTLPVPSVTVAPALQPTSADIPSHTVNGYTAKIESYYADVSHVLFQVRLSGGNINFGDPHFYEHIGHLDLYDENGILINTSGGWGPALDPALIQIELNPLTLFTGDRLKGQLAFDLNNAPQYEQNLAQFRFDIDIPIYPEARFDLNQTVEANGLEILLDSVAITPAFTQIYLCFPAPSFADWNISSQSILQFGDREATPYNFRLLFDSAIGGDRRAGSEPYWAPSVKNGRCLKVGFPIGTDQPTSLTLIIPALEKSQPDILLTDQLLLDYPGLSPRQAYYTYLEEHGNTYKGPWNFIVNFTP